MKKIICIVFLMLCVSLRSQVLDSISIAFKAKILTINKQGISNIKNILDQVDNKEIKFLKTKYVDFIFMKVKFSDSDYSGEVYLKQKFDSIGRTLFGDCSYYLAFNKKSARYYRLGGFDIIDIDSFIDDLEEQEVFIFKDLEGGNEIEEMDIYCLYNYYEMKPKRRLKKRFNCFSKCSKEIVDKIGKPH